MIELDGHAAARAPSARELIRYSMRLGARGVGRGGGPEARARIWMPLDVDRVAELPWAARQVVQARPERVLDVAGPKLLPCWLAEHIPARVLATDLWDEEIARWQTLLRAVDPTGQRFARLTLETADATALPYPDGGFDSAVSVSVIEHIRGNGDTTAMGELARVLRPGGTLVLTFPYGAEPADVTVEHDIYGQSYEGTPLFFQRRYARDTLANRLLVGGAFEIVERAYWNKHAVQSAQARLHRITPARWELGRALGPLLSVIGSRALTPGSPDHPGNDGVLGLVLRRSEVRGSRS